MFFTVHFNLCNGIDNISCAAARQLSKNVWYWDFTIEYITIKYNKVISCYVSLRKQWKFNCCWWSLMDVRWLKKSILKVKLTFPFRRWLLTSWVGQAKHFTKAWFPFNLPQITDVYLDSPNVLKWNWTCFSCKEWILTLYPIWTNFSTFSRHMISPNITAAYVAEVFTMIYWLTIHSSN